MVSDDGIIPARYGALPLFLVAAAFAVIAPFFWQSVELNHATIADTYESQDLYQYYYPTYHYAFSRYAEGELPLWNPRQMCGYPMFADPRLGLFQPLNAVFAFFPTEQAMALHAFLCLFLMGFGTALFLRSLDLRYEAALLGGLGFALSGAVAAGMSRPDTAAALAWAPFIFWAVCATRDTRRRWPLLLGGLAAGFSALSGGLALAVAFSALAVAYLIWLEPHSPEKSRWEWVRRFMDPLIVLGVAVPTSCVMWLPVLMESTNWATARDLVWGVRMAGEMPAGPTDWFIQVAGSSPGSLPRLAYQGIAVLVLAPIAFFHRKRWPNGLFFGAVAASCVLAALFAPWPQRFLSLQPALYFVAAFCMATLAGIGVDRILSPRKGHRAQPALVPVLAILCWSALLFWAYPGAVRGYILALLIVILGFAAFRFRWMVPIAGTLLASVLVIDLATASRNVYVHPYQNAPRAYNRYMKEIDEAARQAVGARLLVSAKPRDGHLPPNLGLIFPIYMAGGAYLPMTVHQLAWWRALANDAEAADAAAVAQRGATQPHLITLMAANALLASPEGDLFDGKWDNPGPALRPISASGTLRMYAIEEALPRSYWVPGVSPGTGAPEDIALMAPTEFDPDSQCIAVGEGAGAALSAQTGSTLTRRDATCSVDDRSSEHLIVRVKAPSDGMTVLTDSFAPGWVARLDGNEVPILRVNGLFRGVLTPEGEHEIEFSYQPLLFYFAAGVSFAGLAVVAIGVLLAGFTRNAD